MVIERQGHDHFLDSSGLWLFCKKSLNFDKENPVLALHRHSFVVGTLDAKFGGAAGAPL